MTERIDELERLLVYHKEKYYLGQAEISDAAYDALEDELRALRPDSPVLTMVGARLPEQKIPHDWPMRSLDKRRTIAEVEAWRQDASCLVTDKMDGSSASLVFENGRRVLAKTRGDGTYGENITRYFAHIPCPKQLAHPDWQREKIEIRGEVCISREQFAALSAEMQERGLEPPNSIRNIVAGLLHRKDHIDLCQYLNFFAYEALCAAPLFSSEREKFALLDEAGFATPHRTLVADEHAVAAAIEDYRARLSTHAFLTDGLVLAIDDIADQEARGSTAHHPKGKLAFKLPSETALTTVEDIEVDVGRSGKVTFVGIVSPVMLSSAQVQRVTLNTARYIEAHNINIGCRIEITRSGEVIPKHERTVETNGQYAFPTHCPLCDTALVRSDTEVDLLCPNEHCRARVLGRIANWIAVVGIENLGDATLDKLWERGLVRSIADLYRVSQADIAVLEGLGEKSAARILESIDGARTLSAEKFLTGLGIEGLGPGVAKLVVARFAQPADWAGISKEALLGIAGIGEVLATQISDGLAAFGLPLLAELGALGVKVQDGEATAGGVLAGESFAVTGALSQPRKEIEKLIRDHGGKVMSAVSKNTAWLICNAPSNSGKCRKAQELQVRIIDEATFYKMIDGQ